MSLLPVKLHKHGGNTTLGGNAPFSGEHVLRDSTLGRDWLGSAVVAQQNWGRLPA